MYRDPLTGPIDRGSLSASQPLASDVAVRAACSPASLLALAEITRASNTVTIDAES